MISCEGIVRVAGSFDRGQTSKSRPMYCGPSLSLQGKWLTPMTASGLARSCGTRLKVSCR